ncbi:MAG: 16S rRNA (adenine(1518)-N(6)/adenine(1519)-N(6))-dimethyltransferase RsmA [Acidobacteriota bacterium]
MPAAPRSARRRPPLRKRYGQHHLRDGALCRPLLDYLGLPRADDAAVPADAAPVIEIGPGGGVLTAELLARGATVLACEIDPAWAFHLRARLGHHPRLRIAILDATRLDAARLPRPVDVVGNLPFNVGTRLIADLLPHHHALRRAAFMVQREVADRLTAGPGSRDYGALSVWTTVHAEARQLGTVPPSAFRPPPKVSAAFVGIEPRKPAVSANERDAFRILLQAAFGQRRKTLRNALRSRFPTDRVDAALAAADLDPGQRAETVDSAGFVRLHRQLDKS